MRMLLASCGGPNGWSTVAACAAAARVEAGSLGAVELKLPLTMRTMPRGLATLTLVWSGKLCVVVVAVSGS